MHEFIYNVCLRRLRNNVTLIICFRYFQIKLYLKFKAYIRQPTSNSGNVYDKMIPENN